MDLEGISWIGNIYQKFEAMCLEVEEIMYEDTIKYVESQVQIVGDSMKRFYSDVMVDLLHPSLTDPGNRAYSDLPAEPDVDSGIYLKPMVGKKLKDAKVVHAVKQTDDLSIVGKKEKDINAVNDKMPPPVFHDLHCCDHPSPPCQSMESAGGARSLNVRQSLNGTKIEIEKPSEHKPDTLCYEQYSDTVSMAESGWREADMLTSSCANNIFEKYKGDYSLVELETIQQMDDEETCVVLVNEDEFQSVPHNEVQSRVSKKMWDVFSSRKSMMRKEYEKLADQHGGDSTPDQQVSAEELMSATAAQRSTSDPCESEWELI